MEEWVCVDGCPVKALGEQSGNCKTGGPGITKKNNNSVAYSGPASSQDRQTIGYADEGGAARFFQQFPGEDDLLRAPVETEAQATIIRGDCVEVMAEMEENSVDAIVCDPPYMLRFMGKKWDQPGAFVERQPERSNKWDMQAGNHNPCNPQDSARTKRVENQRQQEWHERWAREAIRVLKPGGHMLAFGGSRTYHRLVCAIEDAGFEIRDRILHLSGGGDAQESYGPELDWIYGSG